MINSFSKSIIYSSFRKICIMNISVMQRTSTTYLKVSVWRGQSSGKFYNYKVPREKIQMVLDVVTYIQRKLDPTLSYRFSCRVGVCGSCAMTINGKPRWACRTHVDQVAQNGQLTIAPLRSFAVIKDLTVDMKNFFEKWTQAGGAFSPSNNRLDDFAKISPTDKKRKLASAGIECIGCGICFAACDVVKWNNEYLGPAALNRAWTLINDARDAGNKERLSSISQDGGCISCHSQQGCTNACPKHLNPAKSIAGLKKKTLWALLTGNL